MKLTNLISGIWSSLGAPPKRAEPNGGESVTRQLWTAIGAGDRDRTEVLLRANPEQTGVFIPFDGGTWLHLAAWNGNLDIVKLLIASGMDVNILDREGHRTPLEPACAQGQVEVVRYLLDHGAVLDTSSSMSNPLFACIGGYRGAQDEPRERYLTIARLLIDHGIDLTACYTQTSMVDMDAAAFAYEFGRRDICDLIIQTLYGHDERSASGAEAEAIEVALGNAHSRETFRTWRYPPTRGKSAGQTPPPGEYWT